MLIISIVLIAFFQYNTSLMKSAQAKVINSAMAISSSASTGGGTIIRNNRFKLHSPNSPFIISSQKEKKKEKENNKDDSNSIYKRIHFIRHAEGTHNVGSDPTVGHTHLDAPLTKLGIEQCIHLNKNYIQKNTLFTKDLQCVVVSPMTRAIQTAQLCFETNNNNDDDTDASSSSSLPFVACEYWRETVNFLCDKRRDITILQKEFPKVDFSFILNDTNTNNNNNNNNIEDPLWKKYEKIYGSHTDFTQLRESKDAISLRARAQKAWEFLAYEREETEIAVVAHSAFFMHMFDPQFPELEDVIEYCDDDVEALMRPRFSNCELRSLFLEVPRIR